MLQIHLMSYHFGTFFYLAECSVSVHIGGPRRIGEVAEGGSGRCGQVGGRRHVMVESSVIGYGGLVGVGKG